MSSPIFLQNLTFPKGLLLILPILCLSLSYEKKNEYVSHYIESVLHLRTSFGLLKDSLLLSTPGNPIDKDIGKAFIHRCRLSLKNADFWLRYLDPVLYKLINGPLLVEWETEVFEKYENPYKREGAGLSLIEEYIEEEGCRMDSILTLIDKSVYACNAFLADSFIQEISHPAHFYFANRLHILNLLTLYTTGFECPDTAQILPELSQMTRHVLHTYHLYNSSFPATSILPEYVDLYQKFAEMCINFHGQFSAWNQFECIQTYINPLFSFNQKNIQQYKLRSHNFNDYSLHNEASSVVDKKLFAAQNTRGIYENITDEKVLTEIKQTGKLLFFDPILSGNNKRSCASCHNPSQSFTDTSLTSHVQFDNHSFLSRNTLSLLNASHNHLLMADGKHISLETQARFVLSNPIEMGSSEDEIIQKILTCTVYKDSFTRFAKAAHQSRITLDLITSALFLYYADFSFYDSAFDLAIQNKISLDQNSIAGFNLFMGKAKCGTCHFAPIFNGVKPPYIGSEFEVIGIPQDTFFTAISPDLGRYLVHPVREMKNAFRTPTVRNAANTKPYMHNGSFHTLQQVIEFYNNGGGSGKGLYIPNQTLPSDSLKLNAIEISQIISFIESLNENIPLSSPPDFLPLSKNKKLNIRKIGGEY